VAARISHRRIAVLAEGVSLAEGAAKVGTRILVAALKEPLPQAKAEFLQLRMVVTAVPRDGLSAKALLARLAVPAGRTAARTHRPAHRVWSPPKNFRPDPFLSFPGSLIDKPHGARPHYV
jgi:hypothetical protein